MKHPKLTCLLISLMAIVQYSCNTDDGNGTTVSDNELSLPSDKVLIGFGFRAEDNTELTEDVVGDIEQTTFSVASFVPFRADRSALTPTIEVSPNADYEPKGVQDFMNPVVYTVTAEDGSTQDYEVTVGFLPEPDTGLTDKNVLLFLSHEDAYYSEYIIMRRALEITGYTVDVRSANEQPAEVYTLSGNIVSTTLPSVGHDTFLSQFQESFGATWDPSYNELPNPPFVEVSGSILEVDDMLAYDALVVVGGTGAQDYRVDGTYAAQGTGDRMIPAEMVQATAEKLNALALDALSQGKPVIAQCHGASLAPFWRIPGTSGPGLEAMGYSILKEGHATGFPESETAEYLELLNVNYRGEETGDLAFGSSDRVTISSPHSSFGSNTGDYKIITTRDWYSQTVAHAARSLLNIIETHPNASELSSAVSVLILHGGPVNPEDCGVSNTTTNDVPCNFGTLPDDLPADYTHLQDLLEDSSPFDDFNFVIEEVNITDELPYNEDSVDEIRAFLGVYDVVIFYKHWATGVTTNLQNALLEYVDNGGNLLGIHHGLYDDNGKTILTDELFEIASAASTWSGSSLTDYNLVVTNLGHFISTYGITLQNAVESPINWTSTPSQSGNPSYSHYPNIPIYDEIYTNMEFKPSANFGREVNQIMPLFSHTVFGTPNPHTSGHIKYFDDNGDGVFGKLVFLQPGERQENYVAGGNYGQIIRNAVVWLGLKE
ncbi:hypothetical protein [Maribacter sp. 4G9]|uniref:hypothetical protein n=1 Tax=Maribacter sp. 4G9 TaxID=1889777 RepID=UPI000C151372|nr:hypothetical protein [Maribacter sp. 4G9]PIB38415.1 hypothetical protein BFP75_16030 [Maribacter sp. 4G9]